MGEPIRKRFRSDTESEPKHQIDNLCILYAEQESTMYPLVSYFIQDENEILIDCSLLQVYLGAIDHNYLVRHTVDISIESSNSGTLYSKFTELTAFLNSINYMKLLKLNEFQRHHYLPLLASIIDLIESDFCICGAFILIQNNLML